MKKNRILFFAFFFLFFAGCGRNPEISASLSGAVEDTPLYTLPPTEADTTEEESSAIYWGNFGPVEFKSFEAFAQYASTQDLDSSFSYYRPAQEVDGFKLKQVSYRPGLYVMSEYVQSVSPDDLKGLRDYDASRLQTLICRTSLFTDPEADLRINYLPNGYEPVEVNGRTFYRWDEHAGNRPDARTIGYEIVFLEEDHLVFMHLPATESFEEMLRFTDVEKIEPLQSQKPD